jgi:hypothetical protein
MLHNIIEKVCKLLKYGIYFTDLKILNMVIDKNYKIRFIDLDSFYFLGKNDFPIFSYKDIIFDLLPTAPGHTITSNNIEYLEKIMIRKLAIIMVEFFGFNVKEMKKEKFISVLKQILNEKIRDVLSEDDMKIIKMIFYKALH